MIAFFFMFSLGYSFAYVGFHPHLICLNVLNLISGGLPDLGERPQNCREGLIFLKGTRKMQWLSSDPPKNIEAYVKRHCLGIILF